MYFARIRRLPVLILLLMTAGMTGCSLFSGRDPLTVNLVDVEPLQGGDLEVRFALKLRVQNPDDRPVSYQGVALALSVNGRPLANGVSDGSGTVHAYGEMLITVPMSISALSAFRQAWGVMQSTPAASVPYRLTGKLGGGLAGARRFTDEGNLTWPDFNGTVR
ncbi:LEA/WHy family protein [Pseudomonas sp. Marseille-QA0892]